MAVTEVVRALGSWDLQLTPDTPQEIADLLLGGRFGHIAIDAARDNPEVLGDELLSTARYVGVLRGASHQNDQLALSGAGMAFWLGAADDVGDVFETAQSFADAAFADAITELLPPSGAVTAGSITTPIGAMGYTGVHRYQTPRQAIDYVCDLFGCDWRVSGDGALDAGNALFAIEPRAAVIRKAVGVDMGLRALPGVARLESDVEDFSTRVVTLAEGEGTQIQVGTADIAVNPYVDMHGNPVVLTRLVSESNTSATNADARAAIVLDQYTTPRDQISLSTATHDIRGDVEPGDRVWVYDPAAGLVDHANEIVFRGDRISPVLLRVFQVSWPVEAGMGVYFRTPTGRWVDLTDYVQVETGDVNLTVGGYDRPLNSNKESLSFRPNLPDPGADPSIPGVPTFTTPFDEGVYLASTTGLARAQVRAAWSGPGSNTDGSAFLDGAHFEIRYRVSPYTTTATTWAEVEAGAAQWADLHTWENPIALEVPDWEVKFAPADAQAVLIQELTPGTPYDFQIRAVDAAAPPNAGGWSPIYTLQLGDDTIAPDPPAAPEVAGSLVQISVRHNLGLAAGGSFNLPLDLAYLEVHVGASETFTADDTTRVGKIVATRTQINGQIPVIAAFPVAAPGQVWVRVIAVDQAGNPSDPSAAVAVAAELIDSQWVSNLTADKIISSTLFATLVNAGEITSGPDGARYRLTQDYFRWYDADGNVTISFDRATASATLTGTVQTGRTGRRIVMSGGSNELLFYPQAGETRTGAIRSFIPSNFPNDIAIVVEASDTDSIDVRGRVEVLPERAALATVKQDDESVATSFIIAGDHEVTLSARNDAGDSFARGSLDETRVLFQAVNPTTGDADGGYVWLGRGTSGATEIGKVSPSWESWIRFNTGGGIEFYIHGDFQGSIGSDSAAFNSYFGARVGNDFRASLKTDGGSAIMFYWSGGTLNIGDEASGAFIKTFVIDHPLDTGKHLVHATTESPYAGVEYWGTATVQDGAAEIQLPSYFEALTQEEGRVVVLTVLAEDDPRDRLKLAAEQPAKPSPAPVRASTKLSETHSYLLGHEGPARVSRGGSPAVQGSRPGTVKQGPASAPAQAVPQPGQAPPPGLPPTVQATYPKDGRFTVYSHGPTRSFRVMWLVKAIRRDVPQFEVEPLKTAGTVHGDGPYTYLVPKVAAA